MNNKDFNKRLYRLGRDSSSLYNELSYKKIIDYPLDTVTSEEDYMSDVYQVQFKKGFWGSLFSQPLLVDLLGEYGNTEYSRILLEVKTQDKQKVGIVDAFIKTVVPLDYITIELLNIGDHIPLFCCHKLLDEERKIVYDFYTLSGKKIISDVSSYEVTKTSEINYQPKDEDCKISELSYVLKKDPEIINSILFKKQYDVYLPRIRRMLNETIDIGKAECEVCWHYADEGKKRLSESIKYCLARDKKDCEDVVTFELLLDTELFKDPELKQFKNNFLMDHLECNLFFDNDAFSN